MNLLETYLRELEQIRSSGAAVEETSYYGALSNLLNEVGKTLKPRIHCIINIQNRGAGLPDGGFFTADQFQKAPEGGLLRGQVPGRGVLEVKGTSAEALLVAAGEQVSRYLHRYGQVLVTNYRDFVLVGRDAEGNAVKLEAYRLAAGEAAFWSATAHPRRTAETHGERFTEYLKRVLVQGAPLEAPEDVAWFLASYAREARARVERADLPGLAAVRSALEEALGLKFEGSKGEHFFRSTLVQTLFYGVFSAWVLWSKQHPPTDRKARFNWHEAAWSLHVPMIKALYEQVATPSKLGALDLVEVLDWTAVALNRVERAAFFSKFEEGQAVQYFYQPFLEAFDPVLRKELGVWYTPTEIVRYMVARVDTVLREELELPDGLADPRVYVLDPCCGTGAYLVEVLKRIARTFEDKGADALMSDDVKRAAMERVFGFEILPAPFVVAHLQLGLLLQNLGAPLSSDRRERVGVYLTNALTGWEPPKGPKQRFVFPELEEEREAADEVKREKPILVILGNPPYNAFAGVSPQEERGLVEPYKQGLIAEWGIKKFNLDDLYVRFFRLAERRIAEMTGKGVVCYISNFSYLGDPSFVVLRQRFLGEFDAMWFDCMNGDSRETGKLTPDGKPDPSVFSTEYNREGIRVGTAIAVMLSRSQASKRGRVRFRQFWGVTKRADLLESLQAKNFDGQYERAKPDKENRFSFRPSVVAAEYQKWPRVVDLCAIPPSNGLMEKRGGALIDIDREKLEKRMRAYFDPKFDWGEYRALGHGLTEPQARFDPKAARKKAISAEKFSPARLVRYAVRPFDVRWCYYTAVRPIWNEPRPSLWGQCWEGNQFFMTRPTGVASPEGVPVFFTCLLGDNDFLRGHAYYFPLQLKNQARLEKQQVATLFDVLGEQPELDTPIANLSKTARKYLGKLKLKGLDANPQTAGLIWMHALAMGYSPAYLRENAGGIRQDWPRVPLPNSAQALLASARLGRELAALLDSEAVVPGVTSGTLRAELRVVAAISRTDGGALSPEAGDLAVTAGWGHSGKGEATMPGKGKIIARDYTPDEVEAIERGTQLQGLTANEALARLGQSTNDIYLNDVAYWKNVPANVWEYTIGGYQVIKKWLSYREASLLGRSLTKDEVRDVTNMARRIATLLLLEPSLDANYRSSKESAYSWSQ
ncbi:MAG: N-6 DNA methylase [Acidobacteria bacterium]|nr:N-6 DNA methylase [Acidobacteriota bacterium]